MTTSTPRRLILALLPLAGALLACSLSWSKDENTGGANNPAGGGGSGGAPTVRILSPVSGQQVAANQRVDILVETDSAATSFLLNVSGRVASTKAMPPDQSGPTSAILSWQPDREGTYSLEVVAFNGEAASTPAALLLTVVAGAVAGQTSSTTACTGRILVSELNYRDGPGTAANKLGQFEVGEVVTVIGRNADGSWYQFQRYNAQQAWVINNTQWFLVEGTCDTLAVTG